MNGRADVLALELIPSMRVLFIHPNHERHIRYEVILCKGNGKGTVQNNDLSASISARFISRYMHAFYKPVFYKPARCLLSKRQKCALNELVIGAMT